LKPLLVTDISDMNVRTTNVASKINIFGTSVPQYMDEIFISVVICINHNSQSCGLFVIY